MTSFPPGPSSNDPDDRAGDGVHGSLPPPNPYGAPSQPAPYQQPAPYGVPSGYGQPAPYGQAVGRQVGVPPANNLVWGILATVFCCLPLGIVSIVFAAQVNDKWARGDAAGAQDSADKARKFAIWSAAASVVVWVLTIVAFIVFLGAASTTTTS